MLIEKLEIFTRRVQSGYSAVVAVLLVLLLVAAFVAAAASRAGRWHVKTTKQTSLCTKGKAERPVLIYSTYDDRFGTSTRLSFASKAEPGQFRKGTFLRR